MFTTPIFIRTYSGNSSQHNSKREKKKSSSINKLEKQRENYDMTEYTESKKETTKNDT